MQPCDTILNIDYPIYFNLKLYKARNVPKSVVFSQMLSEDNSHEPRWMSTSHKQAWAQTYTQPPAHTHTYKPQTHTHSTSFSPAKGNFLFLTHEHTARPHAHACIKHTQTRTSPLGLGKSIDFLISCDPHLNDLISVLKIQVLIF